MRSSGLVLFACAGLLLVSILKMLFNRATMLVYSPAWRDHSSEVGAFLSRQTAFFVRIIWHLGWGIVS